jgi:hypothetical protein
MKRENNLVLSLLFFVIVFLMQVGEAQNRITNVNVGIVNDIGTAYSNMTLLCINMSLSDFYSSHPETQTRLVTTVVDSKNDVVTAAAAGTRIPISLNLHALRYVCVINHQFICTLLIYIYAFSSKGFFFA